MKKPTHYRVEKVQKFFEKLKERIQTLASVSDSPQTHSRIQELDYIIKEMETEFNLKEE